MQSGQSSRFREMEESISDNLQAARDRIAEAERRAGRPSGSVELLAVSKTWPPEAVAEATEAGQMAFGENRVQELLVKVPVLHRQLRWHLIGHLQRNKVRKVVPLVGDIHSIDSLALARAVDRVAGEMGLRRRIYLQVNVGRDPAKHGLDEEEMLDGGVIEGCAALEHVDLVGLMTIAPISETAEGARPHFVALRELRDRVAGSSGVDLPGLSMGMSGDFEVAIEEGATIVRLGSTVFGRRKQFAAE